MAAEDLHGGNEDEELGETMEQSGGSVATLPARGKFLLGRRNFPAHTQASPVCSTESMASTSATESMGLSR